MLKPIYYVILVAATSFIVLITIGLFLAAIMWLMGLTSYLTPVILYTYAIIMAVVHIEEGEEIWDFVLDPQGYIDDYNDELDNEDEDDE